MPNYSFKCEKCDHSFFLHWCIKEYDQQIKKAKCPECKSKKVYRDYGEDSIIVNYIAGLHECKTLGEYADKKCKGMSNDERNSRLAKQKTQKDPNSGMKELPQGMSRGSEVTDIARKGKKNRGKNNGK